VKKKLAGKLMTIFALRLVSLYPFSRWRVFFRSIESNEEKTPGYKGLSGRIFGMETCFQERIGKTSGVFIDSTRFCSPHLRCVPSGG
jgi:hypothetical protein